MNDKNDVCFAEIQVDLLPLALAQRRSEVVCRHPQFELMRAINLSFRIFERREQT
jgi:hypothetical protein